MGKLLFNPVWAENYKSIKAAKAIDKAFSRAIRKLDREVKSLERKQLEDDYAAMNVWRVDMASGRMQALGQPLNWVVQWRQSGAARSETRLITGQGSDANNASVVLVAQAGGVRAASFDLPAGAFFTLLRDWLQRYRYGVAGTAEFTASA